MRRHREMGKYMKRVFIIIAVLCVVLGLAGTIADSKETTQMTEEIKSYPVIDVSELSEYKEEKENFKKNHYFWINRYHCYHLFLHHVWSLELCQKFICNNSNANDDT